MSSYRETLRYIKKRAVYVYIGREIKMKFLLNLFNRNKKCANIYCSQKAVHNGKGFCAEHHAFYSENLERLRLGVYEQEEE